MFSASRSRCFPFIHYHHSFSEDRWGWTSAWIISRTLTSMFWFTGFLKRSWVMWSAADYQKGRRVWPLGSPSRRCWSLLKWGGGLLIGVNTTVLESVLPDFWDPLNVSPQIRTQRSTWCRMERGWRRRRRQSKRTPWTLTTTSPSASRSRLSRSR